MFESTRVSFDVARCDRVVLFTDSMFFRACRLGRVHRTPDINPSHILPLIYPLAIVITDTRIWHFRYCFVAQSLPTIIVSRWHQPAPYGVDDQGRNPLPWNRNSEYCGDSSRPFVLYYYRYTHRTHTIRRAFTWLMSSPIRMPLVCFLSRRE